MIAGTAVVVAAMVEGRQVVFVSLRSVDTHPPLTEHSASDVEHGVVLSSNTTGLPSDRNI